MLNRYLLNGGVRIVNVEASREGSGKILANLRCTVEASSDKKYLRESLIN